MFGETLISCLAEGDSIYLSVLVFGRRTLISCLERLLSQFMFGKRPELDKKKEQYVRADGDSEERMICADCK